VPDLQTIFARGTVKDVTLPEPSGSESFDLEPGTQLTTGTQRGEQEGLGVPVHPGTDDRKGLGKPSVEGTPGTRLPRSVRLGPKIAFLSLPDQAELGFVDGDTVVINSGHQAYEKAQSAGFVRYHQLMSVAWALTQEKGAESANEGLALLAHFLAAWGEIR